MGILTLLRNAFGRSRRARAAEAEGANRLPAPIPTDPTPSAPTVPEPRNSSPDEHELVSAAFDNVKVPHPSEEPNPEHEAPAQPTTEPAENPAEPVAQQETQPEASTQATAEPEELPEPQVTETAEDSAEKPEAPTTPEHQGTAQATTEPTESAEPKTEEKPEHEGAAEATAEPADLPEEKPEPEASAQATTEPADLPEPETEEKPEHQGAAQATVEAEEIGEAEVTETAEDAVTPEAEDQAGVETVSAATEETTEPQAADGEDAPQGPPAADNESRTGGAGGNTDAEGEAEADDTHAEAPQANAPQANALQAETGDKTPATPLARLKSRTPSLATAYKAATATLKKTGLTGTRAKLYLVLDRSASMRPYYKDGSAQALADQTLALAAHLDPEATVHVVFFSTEVDGTTDLTLTPDHETRIDDVHAGLGRMGRTSYHAAVEAVLAHYEQYEKDTTPDTPALVVFQTDGAPDAKTPATQSLTDAAKNHPSVFFSFVAFGEHDNKAFDYLRKLKTGNTSFFHAGPTPRELTDTELYQGVLAAWRP
ncbi:VWA domain-containing protein [Streptomyces sp. NPDC048191]|uniref:VWA domain-containing protein n=1 Tax=Streptomyces sp. NPDC048191 TaxID=3155484 RepID=UPI0033FDB20E